MIAPSRKQIVLFAMLSLMFLFSFDSYADIRLALNWKPEPQFGGFYAAQEHNFFSSLKEKVQILEGGSGTPTVQMVASGKAEYGIVSADEIILSHDRGSKDLVAIFAVYQTNPQAIMTHEEQKFKNLEDLLKSEGTLLWQQGLPYAQFIQKKYSPLKVRTAPYSGGIGNFLNDKTISQQCFATSEPLLAKKAGVKSKIFLVADTGYNPYTTVVVVKASRLKEKKDEVAKMVQALRQGWRSYLDKPQSTNILMAKLNKAMDLESFAESAMSQINLIEPKGQAPEALGQMSTKRWDDLIFQMKDLGLIKTELKSKDLFVNL